jgi:Zn-dependent peptidase ImmA (M78 family)
MSRIELSVQRMADLSAIAAYYVNEYCSQSTMVEPQVIAKELGLGISMNDYKQAFDGLLENKGSKFHIYLNIKNGGHLYHPRVRFSLAHELGHFLIDEHYNLLRDESVGPQPSFLNYNMDNRLEVEADYFAACLLMPESRIRKDLERQKFNFAVIDEISKKYNVSSTAALLRFVAIGNHPLMVVCSRNSKIAWYRKSDDFQFSYFRLSSGGGVHEYTSAGQYFYEKIKNPHSTETVYAEDWFILSRTEDRRRPFKEYCLYYEPMNQVISVIWES